MKNLYLSLLAASALIAPAASAEPTTPGNNNVDVPERAIVLTGGQNGVNSEVMNVLYDTSDLHFQDPEPPRFLLIDREGRTVFGIGGYLEGVAQYDFDGSVNSNGFYTNMINVPANPADNQRLGADMTHTNLFMQLLTHTRWGVFSAFVQGNFSGQSYGFKLKQAYVRLHNVTAGLTRSVFQDAISGVPTIDYQGPSGAVSQKNVQISYRWNVTRNFMFALSAEMPQATYTLTGRQSAISQRVPDIPAFVQYQWDGGKSHIRASALLRNLAYRDVTKGDNCLATGWAVQLSGAIKCGDFASIFYQGAYGKGYAEYLNDLSGMDFDLIPGADGKMIAPGALGIVGGIRLNLFRNVFISSSYSLCRLYDQQALGSDAYRRGNYAVVNCFYNPVRDVQFGLEYVHGRRTDMSGASGTANRIEAMVKYSF